MPLIIPAIQAKLEAELIVAFTAAFAAGGDGPTIPLSHQKLAHAIAAAVSKVIVTSLQTDAEVAPGIPTPTGPTVGPGKIL